MVLGRKRPAGSGSRNRPIKSWPDFVEVDHGEQAKMEQELFEGSLIEQAASFMLYSQTLRDKVHER